MKAHTDSSIIEHHDDGSWTETTVVTHFPATKRQQTLAAVGVLGLIAAPFMPLITVAALEKFEEKREARREKKRLKSVK